MDHASTDNDDGWIELAAAAQNVLAFLRLRRNDGVLLSSEEAAASGDIAAGAAALAKDATTPATSSLGDALSTEVVATAEGVVTAGSNVRMARASGIEAIRKLSQEIPGSRP